jgi:hypothetical protein
MSDMRWVLISGLFLLGGCGVEGADEQPQAAIIGDCPAPPAQPTELVTRLTCSAALGNASVSYRAERWTGNVITVWAQVKKGLLVTDCGYEMQDGNEAQLAPLQAGDAEVAAQANSFWLRSPAGQWSVTLQEACTVVLTGAHD